MKHDTAYDPRPTTPRSDLQDCRFTELVRSLLDTGFPSEPQIEHWLDRIEGTQ